MYKLKSGDLNWKTLLDEARNARDSRDLLLKPNVKSEDLKAAQDRFITACTKLTYFMLDAKFIPLYRDDDL